MFIESLIQSSPSPLHLLSHSVELVRSLCFAFGVEGEEARQLVKDLADGLNGVSLAYMYHSDSLKSGASYSNEQHIKLKDLVDVSFIVTQDIGA